jgi:hypothetical protein
MSKNTKLTQMKFMFSWIITKFSKEKEENAKKCLPLKEECVAVSAEHCDYHGETFPCTYHMSQITVFFPQDTKYIINKSK